MINNVKIALISRITLITAVASVHIISILIRWTAIQRMHWLRPATEQEQTTLKTTTKRDVKSAAAWLWLMGAYLGDPAPSPPP